MKSFINRSKELNELHDLLSSKGVVITGSLGVGKSELARKYCESYASKYSKVVWIEGDELDDTFALLVKNLFPRSVQSKLDVIEETSPVYRSISKEPTLIVFDDIKNDEVISKYLPSSESTNIKLLITSQETTWPPELHNYSLDALKLVHAFTYMVYNINDDGSLSKDDIKYFVKRVIEKHPYLCQLSVGFMKKHNLSVKEYEKLLSTYIDKLKKPPPVAYTSNATFSKRINAACDIAVGALLQSGNLLEIQLLNTMSFFDVDKIECDLLKYYKADEGTLDSLLQNLEDYSLIASRTTLNDKTTSSYTMYSYIKQIIQENLNESEKNDCIVKISHMVTSSLPDHGKEWARHLIPLIKTYSSNDEIMRVLRIHIDCLSLILKNEGNDEIAKELCKYLLTQ